MYYSRVGNHALSIHYAESNSSLIGSQTKQNKENKQVTSAHLLPRVACFLKDTSDLHLFGRLGNVAALTSLKFFMLCDVQIILLYGICESPMMIRD